MSSGPEYEKVERPLIDQLVAMPDEEGRFLWKWTTGNVDHPSVTGRDSFRKVLIRKDLEDALRRINLGPDGQPWLDGARLSSAYSAMERLGAHKLMEANQAAHQLLLERDLCRGSFGMGRRTHPDRPLYRLGALGEQHVPRGQPAPR